MQQTIASRIPAEEKAQFDQLCEARLTYPATVIRYLVRQWIKEQDSNYTGSIKSSTKS